MKHIVLFLLIACVIFILSKTLTIRIVFALICVLGLIYFSILVANDIHSHTNEKVSIKGNFYLRFLSKELGNNHLGLKNWINDIDKTKIASAENHMLIGKNQVEILYRSEEALSTILENLKQAEHHIHMEYFIIKNGDIAEKIKEVLEQKLREGVKVRIIYDGYGSFFLKTNYLHDLKKAGAEILPFSPPIQSILNLSINHRNHRKILIVDGRVGIIGDSNIADEYFGKKTNLGKWKDINIFMKGDAVGYLQAIFLKDWYLVSGKAITEAYYFPSNDQTEILPVGIITGGLDSPEEQIEKVYISLINSAKQQILIETPYFVPTEGIVKTLENAILRGVDVKIIIPANSDNPVAEYASDIYAKKLSSLGASVYKHKNGFIHSKIIVKDNDVSVIGTANVDYRGLRLDYEVIALIYSETTTRTLEEIFMADLAKSQKIERKYRKGFLRSIGESIIHMIERIL